MFAGGHWPQRHQKLKNTGIATTSQLMHVTLALLPNEFVAELGSKRGALGSGAQHECVFAPCCLNQTAEGG
jgi:hypothetical protein